MTTNATRSDRLLKFFRSGLRGHQDIENVTDFKRLLEVIVDQQDHGATVERLIASPSAVAALQKGLRFNISPDFVNQYTARFIIYVSSRDVKQLCGGQLLQQLLMIVLEPRTIWNAIIDAFKTRKLCEEAVHALAWMMAEVLGNPESTDGEVTKDAVAMVEDGSLLASPSIEIRNLGHRIKYILDIKSSTISVGDLGDATGGRHDNYPADFRQADILPTADEFGCTDKSLYRRAEEISGLSSNQRVAAHLDNQFRLLREDMLSELREDFQAAQGQKKRRRSAIPFGNLSAVGISSGEGTRSHPCSLVVTCGSGLEWFARLTTTDKKKYLDDNRWFLKHHAFGCLIHADQILAFATVDRDVKLLSENPPKVILRIAGDDALKKTLLYLKLHNDVQFMLVETPIFAYEPILKCLQQKIDLPMTDDMLMHEPGKPVSASDLAPHSLVEYLKDKGDGNIQGILRTSKPVKLDTTQLESLLAGLNQKLSLIQGPPGILQQ